MNKKRRQELKQLKFKNRIKRFVANGSHYYSGMKRIDSPTVQDVINNGDFLYYKTTSTPCSCWMCSGYYKYKRHEEKIIVRNLIQDWLDEFLNTE